MNPSNTPLFAGISPLNNGKSFDLAAYLVSHPEHTFYVQVSGESLAESGVEDGDILIVDNAVQPRPSDLVVIEADEGFTVKKFNQEHRRLRLLPAKPLNAGRICGVAIFAIHSLIN